MAELKDARKSGTGERRQVKVGFGSATKVLVTGAAGFIGFHLCRRLLSQGYSVVGLDNLDDYYDVRLKEARLRELSIIDGFRFRKVDITDIESMRGVFREVMPDVVVNLAGQAGVRYSIENPFVYVNANITGLLNVLELCREVRPKAVLYASSSSVYGGREEGPFRETDTLTNFKSIYAITKYTAELVAQNYFDIHRIGSIGLRFFTVYGPMGRPDMAYFRFVDDYLHGKPIHVFDTPSFDGNMSRDFTYVDDITQGICLLIDRQLDGGLPGHRVVNIGNSNPERLSVFISTLEWCLGRSLGRTVEFERVFEGLAPGDVELTHASTDTLHALTGWRASTPLVIGLQKFCDWYVQFFRPDEEPRYPAASAAIRAPK